MGVKYFVFILFCIVVPVQSAPLVQNVSNQTDIGYMIIAHSDNSLCSLHKKNQIIDVSTMFQEDFLLQKGEPGLVMRPAYYYDKCSDTKIWLLDQNNQVDYNRVDQAYNVWRLSGKKRKFKDSYDWYTRWVGKDVVVFPNLVEVYGYLINLSRVHIQNSIKQHATWLSFSKGVFSRLVLEVDLVQHDRKGVKPLLKVIAGEGGICKHGLVERL
tara:strand:+ start:473 stop:1111 length:639 start_codon:yes stop_codon:yes gene_type:complete